MPNIEYLFYFLGSIVMVFIIASTLKKFTGKTQCPYCKSSVDLERIKSPSFIKLIPGLNAKHFICYKCNKKHYRISFFTDDKLLTT
jgi:transposase-like protein